MKPRLEQCLCLFDGTWLRTGNSHAACCSCLEQATYLVIHGFEDSVASVLADPTFVAQCALKSTKCHVADRYCRINILI